MLTQLKQLGLSENEVKVYLASLELGEATAQQIAEKAGINRPTAYVQIENLIKMGLMSSIEKGKKRYFFASPPDQLSRFLDKEKTAIEEKTKDFEKILPELTSLFSLGSAKEKPKVRFFEGKEGIKTMREDILKSKIKILKEFIPFDDSYKFFPASPDDHRQKLAKKSNKIPRKIIYTSKRGAFLPKKERVDEYKFIPPEKFPFHTEMIIYGNKTALIAHGDKLIGVIIESENIAGSFDSFFNLAWEAADKYQK